MDRAVKIALDDAVYQGLCERLLDPPLQVLPAYLSLPTLHGVVVFYPDQLRDIIGNVCLPIRLPPDYPVEKAEPEQLKSVSAVAGRWAWHE